MLPGRLPACRSKHLAPTGAVILPLPHLSPAPQAGAKALGLVLGRVCGRLGADGSSLGGVGRILLCLLQGGNTEGRGRPGNAGRQGITQLSCVLCLALSQRSRISASRTCGRTSCRCGTVIKTVFGLPSKITQLSSTKGRTHHPNLSYQLLPHLAAAKHACQPAAALLLALLHCALSPDGGLLGTMLQVSGTVCSSGTRVSSCRCRQRRGGSSEQQRHGGTQRSAGVGCVSSHDTGKHVCSAYGKQHISPCLSRPTKSQHETDPKPL